MPPKAPAPKAPAKPKPLIKGQGSLQGYFSGGSMARAEGSGGGASGSGSSATPPKKDKDKPKERPPPEVKQMTEPVTVRGYTPSSMSPSPSKSKAPPIRPRPTPKKEDEVTEAATSSRSNGSQSKYFPETAKKAEPNKIADDDDDDEEEEVKPAKGRGRVSAANAKKRKIEDDDDDDDDYEEEKAQLKSSPRSKSRASAASKKSPASKTSTQRTKKARKQESDDEQSSDLEMVEAPPPPKAKKAPAAKAGSSKNNSIALDDDDDDDEDVKRPVAPAAVKSTAKASGSSAPAAPPKPAKEEDADAKAALKASRDRAAQGPSAPGSKEIPQGAPNCLIGLTFVFTGQLESLEREEAQNLVKGLGAKVTGAPSSKTSFVVVGEGAGPSKLKKIEAQGLKTIDENGLLDLIRSKEGAKPDEAALKKLKEEEKKIEKAAKAMEVGGGGAGIGHKGAAAKPEETDSHALWTTKYAPSQMKDLVGNNAAIEKLKGWLEGWPASYKSNFKKPGKFGYGCFRGIMLSGPPGIGKTSAAHLVARLCGYAPIELNASDARSKKLIEHNLKSLINNKSLDGWYGGGGMTVEGITIRDNTVLILDEVDGMSGGDRGGVGAINQLIKKTRIPIILICNDRKSAKMKPFDHTTFGLPFQRPKADSIRSRLQTIAFREKLKVDKNGMDMLISAAQNDIRLVINMLSTWKLGQSALSYDDSKKLGAENVKPGMPTPWSLYSELSSHALWAASSKKTLNQKTEIYFSDMGMVPLFVQENYIRQRPQSTMGETDTKKKDLKTLQLLNGAAAAISDGDVVDNMIHGSQQQWSLLPLHAVQSTLKPMSLMYGMGPEGSYGPAFPAWFGQNSKQGRLFRATVELQTKMRLTASGSRHEVREQYLPHLFTGLSKPLLSSGASGIPDVVELLDAYYLNLEDRENIMELGVGKNNGDEVLKKVPTAVKSAFTRQYNAASHPIALQRGDLGSGGRAKQLVGDAAPDAEEAIIQDEVVDESGSEMGDSDDDLDFTKDKMIKEKKQKAAKGKAKAK